MEYRRKRAGLIAEREKKKTLSVKVCKISGKIEFSHHVFVVTFLYAESKEEAPHEAGRGLRFLLFSNN